MRILFFTSDASSQSGASYALRETANRLTAAGTTVILVLPDLPDTREMFRPSRFSVRYIKMHRLRRTLNPFLLMRGCWSLFRVVISLQSLISRHDIDVVHSNEIMDLAGGLAAVTAGVPSIFHVRADGLANPYRFLLTRILQFLADAIIVPSKSTAVWLATENAALQQKIHFIPDFAFDYPAFDPDTSGIEFRRERNIPTDAIVVLLVSKLMVEKGHLCFISAAEKILRRSRDFVFLIVGDKVQGHEQEAAEISSFANQIGLSVNLQLVGKRTDLPAVYAAADIVVHCPIFPDTYPTVILLAMLMGKPVVASKIGGISEQIEDGVTGRLVTPNDPSALASAVLELGTDTAKRTTLGLAGMNRLRREFSPKRQTDALIDLYQTVVLEPKSSEVQS